VSLATADRATELLPGELIQLVDHEGNERSDAEVPMPITETARELLRKMILGRRLDEQATTAVRQGRLAVYPSSHGQEACQIGVVQALATDDWLFPTYRDCVALLTRGIDPAEVFTLLRGDWHCGYDPVTHRVAPQCTPLATNALHAVGLAHALRHTGQEAATLAFIGDGATSEGDTHEALNFAAVFATPAVIFVQNNGFAISVPVSKQTRAPTLAHKGIGYGVPGVLVDGNDVLAVYAVTSIALERARSGAGPTLIEALTYRLEAHTNADDAHRYRRDEEVASWRERDPIERLTRHLVNRALVDEAELDLWNAQAEAAANELRATLAADPNLDPADLFAHVYAEATPALRHQSEQVAQLAVELNMA